MKATLLLMFFSVLALSADLTVYQRASEEQMSLIRETTTTGLVQADFGKAEFSGLGGSIQVFDVTSASNRLQPELPTLVYLDAMESGETVTVGIAVDGKLTWATVSEQGLIYSGTVRSELALFLLEAGGNMVRRIEVQSGSATNGKAESRAASSSGPISLQFLVRRPNSNQICEVIPGSNLGGNFYSTSPKWILGYYVNCKTDRVSRGESIITALFGYGYAEAGIRTPYGTFAQPVWLSTAQTSTVSSDPNFDNLVAFLCQGPFEATLRVPIGRR